MKSGKETVSEKTEKIIPKNPEIPTFTKKRILRNKYKARSWAPG